MTHFKVLLALIFWSKTDFDVFFNTHVQVGSKHPKFRIPQKHYIVTTISISGTHLYLSKATNDMPLNKIYGKRWFPFS